MPTYRGPGLLAPLALLTRAHGMDLVGWARVGFSVILLSLRTWFFPPLKATLTQLQVASSSLVVPM